VKSYIAATYCPELDVILGIIPTLAVTGTRFDAQEKLVRNSNENSVTATGQLMLLGF